MRRSCHTALMATTAVRWTIDYRISVLWQITTRVWQAQYNIPPVIWWNNLERVLLAVNDLGCRDLLA